MSEQQPSTNPSPNKETEQQFASKRQKEYESNRKALDELCTLYPELFSMTEPKPLKISIHKDLAVDGKMSKTRIRRALNLYVRRRKYISSLIEGAKRISIGNIECGEVTKEEALHASQKIKEIDAKRKRSQANKQPTKHKSAKPQKHNKPLRAKKIATSKPANKPDVSEKNAQERFQAKLEALITKK